VVCIAAWWQFIFADPNRVLSDMLDGNLRTSGVVKNIQQGDAQSSLDQSTYLSFTDGPKTQTVTTLEQTGASGEKSRVITENIGTPEIDYIKYRTIDVPQSSGQGDVSAAENVWASKSHDDEGGQQTSFLNEGLFGIVVYGNFNQQQANSLKDLIDEREVYQYSSVSKTFESGRPVYKYQMELLPYSLIGYMSEYAGLLGVDDRGQLDPENYKDAPAVKATFTVDVLSRQLTSIEYEDTGRVEQYNSFGLKRAVESPSDTIPLEELQRRLQPGQ
jgi:hypothetical protein